MKRAWCELRGPRTTPARAAAAVALGLFIGSIPIFGLHTPLVIGLCVWLQLDAAVAWLAANVSNPFFAPFLMTAEVELGAWLCTGAPFHWSLDPSRAHGAGHLLRDLFAGAPLTGMALAGVGALVAYAVAAVAPASGPRTPYRLPDHAPPWLRSVERVAARYASPVSASARERARFHYVRGKLLADPVARLVARLAAEEPGGFGAVMDVGAGRGQLGLLLLELGHATRVHGVDWDERKIDEARRASSAQDGSAGPLPATFDKGDVRRAPFETADTVLLIDVLHYLRPDEQDATLDRAAAAVRPGGRILVREADAAGGWRAAATWIEEVVFTLARHNRGERVVFRKAGHIVARLESAGLRCEAMPAWGATPFSNVLVVGRRAG